MSLIINNITTSFEDKTIFDGFSYSFPEVGLYAITGKSGIGKTTLLRMIAGLDTKFSGNILGGGFKNVSYAFQEYRLFPTLTALDNVILASYDSVTEENSRDAKKLLLSLGFSEDEVLLLPHQLSGGMKQRVSLARAILKKSPVLLLDEPTKELNSELSDKVIDIIKSESQTRLVIIVTHNVSDIEKSGALVLNLGAEFDFQKII